ncbi:ABC transporter ATP-binding protein [Paenibacillus cineris]|uniref:ABC transporter ATP-binding protein n=1 Tax=Paenibacillus cineris TaxID=237530 RepID=UPI001B0E0D14|nr:ATP-binding cassette domain-containing protein [Paenibacillus cineris]GIO61400.1 ABC transporter [Paenibacillus cineris]
MNSVLEVEGITKLFRNHRGVKDVSFAASEGEVFGFIGPNGAGKTTVLKIITGLIRPDRGNVRIMGHDIAERFEQAVSHTGSIIETPEAYEYMSARDNLKLSARFYKDLPASRIDEVLEKVGLKPYRHERVRGFSLGMKQRLGLASALLSAPRLVLLDEPTNGLDIEGMADFRSTVRQLADQGITFLISSHLIYDLSLIADRVGVMREGHLISLGREDEWNGAGLSLEQYVTFKLLESKEGERDAQLIRQSAE